MTSTIGASPSSVSLSRSGATEVFGMTGATSLLADIGGTNARFALLQRDGTVRRLETVPVANFETPQEAIRSVLERHGEASPPLAVLAIAGPIHRQPLRLTNAAWKFDCVALARETGIGDVRVINDFAAQAWAVPGLEVADLVPLGGGAGVAGAARLVVGPGTGLGVATYLPGNYAQGDRVVSGEGGHAALPAEDDRDAALLTRLRRRFGRVSAERVLSGSGLVALGQAVAEEDGLDPPPDDPIQLVQAARKDVPVASETLLRFVGFLGSYAGDVALIVGAWGGVYLSGGIAPRLQEDLQAGHFRARFEAKGRFEEELRGVPTKLVVRTDPAFLGLAELARRLT